MHQSRKLPLFSLASLFFGILTILPFSGSLLFSNIAFDKNRPTIEWAVKLMDLSNYLGGIFILIGPILSITFGIISFILINKYKSYSKGIFLITIGMTLSIIPVILLILTISTFSGM
jgi:hypothetical protein